MTESKEVPMDGLPPSPEELDEIERIKDQGHFGSHEAQNRVLGPARAAAWRSAEEQALPSAGAIPAAPDSSSPRREEKDFNLRLVRLANAATQSELDAKEFLVQQPPSPERDKLLEAFKDSEAA